MNFEEFVTSIPEDGSSVFLKRIFLNRYDDINSRIRTKREITYEHEKNILPATLYDLRDEMFLLINNKDNSWSPFNKIVVFVDRDKFLKSDKSRIVSQQNGGAASISYLEKEPNRHLNSEYVLRSTWRGVDKPFLEKIQTVSRLKYNDDERLFVKETKYMLPNIEPENKPCQIIHSLYNDIHLYKNDHNQLHRLNGPAEIHFLNHRVSHERWYFEDRLHRENDQPAEIYYDQLGRITKKSWYQNGKRERKKGPAEVYYQYDHHAVVECYYKDDTLLGTQEREM